MQYREIRFVHFSDGKCRPLSSRLNRTFVHTHPPSFRLLCLVLSLFLQPQYHELDLDRYVTHPNRLFGIPLFRLVLSSISGLSFDRERFVVGQVFVTMSMPWQTFLPLQRTDQILPAGRMKTVRRPSHPNSSTLKKPFLNEWPQHSTTTTANNPLKKRINK